MTWLVAGDWTWHMCNDTAYRFNRTTDARGRMMNNNLLDIKRVMALARGTQPCLPLRRDLASM